jgi:hypothetical protein
MGINVILTGATGMVGEGVLRQCLMSPEIDRVLIVGRRSAGVSHQKIKEILLTEPGRISPGDLPAEPYHACLFALGVSSVGMKEEQYSKLTYDLTIGFAEAVKNKYPGLTFCYISGAGSDSTEKGRSMWARVKGRTENQLLQMFEKAYMFRPGIMKPDPGAKNTLGFYKYVTWMFPAIRTLFPRYATTLAELGQAMIECALRGYGKKVIEVPDIVMIAKGN